MKSSQLYKPYDHAGAVAFYLKRKNEIEASIQQTSRTSKRISYARGAVFLGMLTCIVWRIANWPLVDVGALGLAVLGLILFVGLVFYHSNVIQRIETLNLLADIQAESIHRLHRHWNKLSHIEVDQIYRDNPIAVDLDICTSRKTSLLQLLGRVHLPGGKNKLADWLLNPSAQYDIRTRQQACQELCDLHMWRQDFELEARRLSQQSFDPEIFLTWAENPTWLKEHPVILWIARGLSLTTLIGIALHLTGVTQPYWLIWAAVNLLFTAVFSKRIQPTFTQLGWRQRPFYHFSALFGLVDKIRFSSPGLLHLKQGLSAEGRSAYHQMRNLERLSHFIEIRKEALLYLPLQALILWDFHLLDRLENWRHTSGTKVRSWFEHLSDLEALCSLAGFAYDHPEYTYPRIDDRLEKLNACKLGHPMLPVETCVKNDVTVGPRGHFLLITGSNLSGKSTLLRSIGVNIALAQAGTIVCAHSFEMPPIILGTSFRIRDSLEEGVSYYMAELQRIKSVVDLALKARETQQIMLFLLDEILQGTNAAERHIAVKQVLAYLLEQGGLGCVSTHDLDLANVEELKNHSQVVHFKETYLETPSGPRMQFDYRLYPGLAQTTNALKLLQLVGLTGTSRKSNPS